VAAALVESGREALEVARANVAALNVGDRVHVVASDVAVVLGRPHGRPPAWLARHGPFDLVLADPPWSLVDAGKVTPVLAALVTCGALVDVAVVVLEHSSRTPPPDIAGLDREDSRRYGDATLTFYKPAILAPPAP
jgi:16S rRNA (guanine966-N2)-methyltransferase